MLGIYEQIATACTTAFFR